MRKMVLTTILAAAGTLCCVSLAVATDIECHSNDQYMVAIKPFGDEPGNLFAITALNGKKAGKCRFDFKRADRIIGKRDDALWFGQQAGKFLILSRSTGPQGDLVVYDLSNGKSVLDVPADEYNVDGDKLSYWERGEEANEGNCPQFKENEANGWRSLISTHKTLDLGSLEISESAEQRCDTTQ